MRFCLTIGGITYCIDIPVLYDPWWWIRPDPPPELSFDPSDWIREGGRRPEWAQEAQILATAVTLARRSPQLYQGLQAGFERAAADLQTRLPEGVKVHLAEAR